MCMRCFLISVKVQQEYARLNKNFKCAADAEKRCEDNETLLLLHRKQLEIHKERFLENIANYVRPFEC